MTEKKQPTNKYIPDNVVAKLLKQNLEKDKHLLEKLDKL